MEKGNFFFLFFLSFHFSFVTFSQTDYLVYFKDKDCATYSISNPSEFLSESAIARRQRQNIAIEARDLPVCIDYINQIKNLGIQVRYPTKWMNGAVVRIANSIQLSQLSSLPFVQNSNALSRTESPFQQLDRKQSASDKFYAQSVDSLNYGSSGAQLEMLGINTMHNEGVTGKGIKVAIFDAGFLNANALPCFQHLFNSGRVKATYDVSNDKSNVYDMGNHGLSVFSTMAANQPGDLIGGAYGADYFLYHTEVVATEYPVEEANWLRAAEMADSSGVDIINSSLGYSDFDNSIFDHTYSDMNGSTTLISKAADFASKCGMLVVNSAGNYGNDPWHYIVAPGDVASVLTVGAVDKVGQLAYFSSVGPSSDGRLKPDVVAPGNPVRIMNPNGFASYENGTSFSTPLTASLAAGLWQAFPNLTNAQLRDIIKASASLSDSPNNEMGFGIPNYKKAKEIATFYSHTGFVTVFPNPSFRGNDAYLRISSNDIGRSMEVSIIDNVGKVIKSENIQNSLEINWLNLDSRLLLPGCYFVRVKFSDKTQTFKLIYY